MLRKTSWPRGWTLEPAGREQLLCAFRCLTSVNKCQVSCTPHDARSHKGGFVLSNVSILEKDVQTANAVNLTPSKQQISKYRHLT